MTPLLDGWHGDASRMYLVGAVSLKARCLVEVTYEALMRGIEQARPGNHLGGHRSRHRAVRRALWLRHCARLLRPWLGRVFHDAPEVLHVGQSGSGPQLRPGMFFTIEPMLNAGSQAVKVLKDGWTIVTCDHSLSAQFEHSIGITATGCEIFTLSAAER
ncbi:M24 family metallopeptidase [Hyphomicrobium sp. DY-1]|uniref:M24 family metallopeptidase n=1 Tax=Hyphomicrobium sp. DY-1 TaxID=3075650 RepID=UPI0039C0BF60